jgi:DNA-binding LytR/AlgR family response regulator
MAEELKIAVCDDEEIYTDKITKIVECYFRAAQLSCKITKFSSANDMFVYSRAAGFDLILLDIDMPDISGIKAAEKIRDISENIPIVFITNMDNFVFEAIKYTPFRFIRKQFLSDEMSEMLAAFKNKHNNDSVFLDAFDENERAKRIKAIDVCYIESFGHTIDIHHNKGILRVKQTLNDLEKQLSDLGFIRIHKSYLVNYRFIYEIADGFAVMDDENKLAISRYRARDVKNKFMKFTRGEMQ